MGEGTIIFVPAAARLQDEIARLLLGIGDDALVVRIGARFAIAALGSAEIFARNSVPSVLRLLPGHDGWNVDGDPVLGQLGSSEKDAAIEQKGLCDF
jgi:hypothetical protein